MEVGLCSVIPFPCRGYALLIRIKTNRRKKLESKRKKKKESMLNTVRKQHILHLFMLSKKIDAF